MIEPEGIHRVVSGPDLEEATTDDDLRFALTTNALALRNGTVGAWVRRNRAILQKWQLRGVNSDQQSTPHA